jgi:hypothetical protein
MYFLQSAEYGKKIIIKNQIMWRSHASLDEADIIAGVVNIVRVSVIIFSQKNKKSLPIPKPWDGKLRDTTQIAGTMHLPLKRPVKVSHPLDSSPRYSRSGKRSLILALTNRKLSEKSQKRIFFDHRTRLLYNKYKKNARVFRKIFLIILHFWKFIKKLLKIHQICVQSLDFCILMEYNVTEEIFLKWSI